MINEIEYEFDTEALAYRFLNTVRHFDAEQLKVKFGRSDRHVKVSYRVSQGKFDELLARLDDTAQVLNGIEVG